MASALGDWAPVHDALKKALGGTIKRASDFDDKAWKGVFDVLDTFSSMRGSLKRVAGWIGVERSTLGKRYDQRAASAFGQGRKPQVPLFLAKEIAERLSLSARMWRAEPRTQGHLKIIRATEAAGFGRVSMKVARSIAATGDVLIKRGEATGAQKTLNMSRPKIMGWFANMMAAGVNKLPPDSILNMDEHDLNARAKKYQKVRLPYRIASRAFYWR